MSRFALAGDSHVTIRTLYGDADMAPEVAELVVELNASKEYEAKMLNAPYHQS